MSRERVRRHIPNFLRGWDRAKSRIAGHGNAYSDSDAGPFRGTEIDADVEVMVRNRSGERRRTGKRLKDVG